jgi:hypothetical protein
VHLCLPRGTSPQGPARSLLPRTPTATPGHALLHAPGLDQRPSVLSSSQSPSGLGNLNSFGSTLYRNTLGSPYNLVPVNSGSTWIKPSGSPWLFVSVNSDWQCVSICCRGGRVYKLASCPLVPTLFAFLLGSYIRGPPCFSFFLFLL